MSKRVVSFPGGAMSSAIMLHERSNTIMISTPLACVSVCSFTQRGPAIAMIVRATVSVRRKMKSRPAIERTRPPIARTSSTLEKRSAPSAPARPRTNAYSGSSARKTSTHGC